MTDDLTHCAKMGRLGHAEHTTDINTCGPMDTPMRLGL